MFKSNISRRHLLTGASAIGISSIISRAPSAAETYPDHDLRWIIYQSPGGLIDSSTRAVQPFLKQQGFGSTVDYVRGASGRIARAQLFRSEPDGYSLMTEASPEEVMGEVIYKAEYKVSELQPVYGWFRNAFNICVLKNSPIKSFPDLVKEAKSRKVTIGTLGKGGPSHLQLAMLNHELGTKLQFVHFDGGAPAYTAVAGGHVEAAVGGSTSSQWSHTVDFLVVFRDGRDPALPNVPTAKELGYDITPINEVIYVNTGPKVPADRVKKLTDAFAKVFSDPAAVEAQKKLGIFPTPMAPAQLRQGIQDMFALVREYKSDLTG